MSECHDDHHDEAIRLANFANDLLSRASGAQAEDFQRQALGYVGLAQVHATLAAGGYACAPAPVR